MQRQYNLTEIRLATESIPSRHDNLLAGVEDLSDALLSRVLRCCELANSRPEKERGYGTFLLAYQLLAAKSLSHAESIRLLTRSGRYGDASMIIRGLIGDQLMTQYLSIYPGDCSDWFEMSDLREPKPVKGTKFAKLKGKFSESAIRSAIEVTGATTSGSASWGVYSESGHPSAWGFKFYGVQEVGELAGFRMTYLPVYQPIAAFRCIAMLAALLLDVVNDFYYWMQKTGQNWGAKDIEMWAVDVEVLGARVASAFNWLEEKHVEIFGDPLESEDDRAPD